MLHSMASSKQDAISVSIAAASESAHLGAVAGQLGAAVPHISPVLDGLVEATQNTADEPKEVGAHFSG